MFASIFHVLLLAYFISLFLLVLPFFMSLKVVSIYSTKISRLFPNHSICQLGYYLNYLLSICCPDVISTCECLVNISIFYSAYFSLISSSAFLVFLHSSTYYVLSWLVFTFLISRRCFNAALVSLVSCVFSAGFLLFYCFQLNGIHLIIHFFI